MVGLEAMELLEMQLLVAVVALEAPVALVQQVRVHLRKLVDQAVQVNRQALQEQLHFMLVEAEVVLTEHLKPQTVPWRHPLEIPERAEAVLVVQVALKQMLLTQVIMEIEVMALGEP
jgi:hypothetical protein